MFVPLASHEGVCHLLIQTFVLKYTLVYFTIKMMQEYRKKFCKYPAWLLWWDGTLTQIMTVRMFVNADPKHWFAVKLTRFVLSSFIATCCQNDLAYGRDWRCRPVRGWWCQTFSFDPIKLLLINLYKLFVAMKPVRISSCQPLTQWLRPLKIFFPSFIWCSEIDNKEERNQNLYLPSFQL